MSNPKVLQAIIPDGDTVSNAVPINPQIIVGLVIPTIDAAVVYINVKAESGDSFVRLQTSDGAGDFSVASSTGDKAVWIPDLAPFPFIQVETSVAQSPAVTFKLVYKNPSKEAA